MKKIKICAVQCPVTDNFEKNLSKAGGFFQKASSNDADIICFPEVFLTGGLYRRKYDPDIPKRAKSEFSRLSKKYKIHSVMGSIIEKTGRNYYNISYLFDDHGKTLGSYKKIHLVPDTEARYLSPGKNPEVFKTKLGNIGIQICRDILYPEITRKLMMSKAQIIFCPSFWCSRAAGYGKIYNEKYFCKKTPNEVTSLVSARSIESGVFFVFVNAAGTFNHEEENVLLGKTQIGEPFYGTTKILRNNKQGVLVAEIDLQATDDAEAVYRIKQGIRKY